jgi:hypothetical protein
MTQIMTKPTNTRQPTSHIAPFGVRMQPDLKARLEAAAVQSGRSMNAEIIRRLETTLEMHSVSIRKNVSDISGDIPYGTEQDNKNVGKYSNLGTQKGASEVHRIAVHLSELPIEKLKALSVVLGIKL